MLRSSQRCMPRLSRLGHQFTRSYKVLAIETSCDDTCVALLDRPSPSEVHLVQHIKSTLNSVEEGGIIPTRAFDHHQSNIARITQELCTRNGLSATSPPDVICVTRGPGMKGSLCIGLDFAKGLSIAWGKPMVGVHHMLGHLLVPRFESGDGEKPEYPLLSLLISGGHTMIVLSKSLLEHEVLCETIDVACGDAVDKSAREMGLKGNNLGKELESYVQSTKDYWQEKEWDVPKPLYNKRGRIDQLAFAFGAFQSYLRRMKAQGVDIESEVIRRSLAYQIQRGIFQHVTNKLELTLEKHADKLNGVKHFVGSGGVASNMFLRNMLDDTMNKRGIKTTYPSVGLCTDNAVMIGWAGIELYESGLTTDLKSCPISKWPLSAITQGVPGWIQN